MSEEREDNADDDTSPVRRIWSTPTLTILAIDEAAAGFVGVGGDNGLYS